jgi:hypothetical protein
MALVLLDRVKDSTTTTGTGTLTLSGSAATGFQNFSGIGNGNTTYYCISSSGSTEWEVGLGTYTSSGTTLSRDTVLSSSNSGALVNLSAGTKEVFCVYPSSKSLLVTASTGAIIGPSGTTGERPGSPAVGMTRYNTTTSLLEAYIGSSWVSLVDQTSTQTLTNKRITPRVDTTASSATPTINTDNVDVYGLTAQAEDITSFTTNLSGTPTNGQRLLIYIVGTAARAITWGASFEASTTALPTTTVTTDRLDVGFVWNAATSKWRCVAVA